MTMTKDNAMTPLELYGRLKIEAARNLKAAHELEMPESKVRARRNPDAVFFRCLLNALEAGTFSQQMKLYNAFPEFVEAYDEARQHENLEEMWVKYGI